MDLGELVWQINKSCFNEMTLSMYHKNPGSLGSYDLNNSSNLSSNLDTLLSLSYKLIPENL